MKITMLFNKDSHFVSAGSDLAKITELEVKASSIYNNLNIDRKEKKALTVID